LHCNATAGDGQCNASALVSILDLVALGVNGTLVDGTEGILDLTRTGGNTSCLGAIGRDMDNDDGLTQAVSLGGDIGNRVPIQSSVGLLMRRCTGRWQVDSMVLWNNAQPIWGLSMLMFSAPANIMVYKITHFQF
jgi:hypothetical protein